MMDIDLELELKSADINDADLLFSWANDMDVRRNSFHQETIAYDDHIRWLSGKLSADDCQILIASLNQRSVGQVRFDIEDGIAWIDYSVDAQFRGRGIATVMLNHAMELADRRITEFAAQVKSENKASMRVFEKCGFTRCGEGAFRGTDAYVEFRKKSASGDGRIPTIVICTQKSWNIANAKKFREMYAGRYQVEILTEKEELTAERLDELQPEYVFIPHWSYIIPESVYGAYTCVVFHMTDLPFGRGGSPLQNLIVRGYTHTKISALHVGKGLDTGDIYLKEDLELSGTADEILRRTSDIIFRKMIPWILRNRPEPVPQQGEPVVFKRRKPEDGKLLPEMDERKLYDMIRMLDGEGYPPAFVDFGDYTLEFSGADLQADGLTAKVRFVRKQS